MEALIINPKSVKAILALALASCYITIVTFIEAWIWTPYWSLIIFVIFLAMDYVSALLLAFKRGKGFDSAKSRKFAFQVVCQIAALGMVYNFPKLNLQFGHQAVQLILESLPGWTFMFMLSYNFLSFLKNATLLGGFNGPVAKFLWKYIDPHKNEPKD